MNKSIKAELIEIAQNLPDDCTYEDMQYQLYVRTKIQYGLRQAESDEVISHEEVERRFAERWAST